MHRNKHAPARSSPLLLLQGLNFRAVPARSLEWDRPVEQPRPEVEQSKFRQLLLSISGFYSKESQLLRGRTFVLNEMPAIKLC